MLNNYLTKEKKIQKKKILNFFFQKVFLKLTNFTIKILQLSSDLGMAIPRRISFLEESRSRGMRNLHSSGIEEYEIYFSGSSGNFEEWVIQKITKNSWKSPQKFKWILKNNSNKIQHWFYISKLGNNTKNWSWNTEKFRQISENFLKFSYLKEIQYFRGPRQILARIRGS